METKIQFERVGIGEVIKRHRQKVPSNQREYAWEEEHVKALLTDIAGSMHKDVYFLGIIVLMTTPKSLLEVADGQQRLATTTKKHTTKRDKNKGMNDEFGADSIEREFLFTSDIE